MGEWHYMPSANFKMFRFQKGDFGTLTVSADGYAGVSYVTPKELSKMLKNLAKQE